MTEAEKLIEIVVNGDSRRAAASGIKEARLDERWVTLEIVLSSLNPAWSKAYDMIADLGVEILVIPKVDEAPIPWDADIGVKGSNIVLEGHVDANGLGYARAEFPKGRASSYFSVSIGWWDKDVPVVRDILDRSRIRYKIS